MAPSKKQGTIGEQLKQERLAKKLTLDAIAKDLCIQKIYLVALEKDSYESLPERVFAIGFLNAYARHLGLDPKPLVAQFKLIYSSESYPEDMNDLKFPTPSKLSKFPSRRIIFGSVVLFVLLLLIWGFYFVGGNKVPLTDPIEVPLEIIDSEEAEAIDNFESRIKEKENFKIDGAKEKPAFNSALSSSSSSSSSAAAAQKENAPLAVSIDSIELHAIEDSWFKITDESGRLIVSKLLQAGKIYQLPKNFLSKKLLLDVGNAGGVELIIAGENRGVLGQSGRVRRAIPLN